MLFTLKKYLGGMMLPLPLLLLLMAVGIALLWFSRFQRTGKLCVSLGWLLLLLLSLQPVADSLLKPIEDKYPTWRGEKRVQYVVVLGGGYTWNPDWAPSSNLINNSLPRLTEGIRQSVIRLITGEPTDSLCAATISRVCRTALSEFRIALSRIVSCPSSAQAST